MIKLGFLPSPTTTSPAVSPPSRFRHQAHHPSPPPSATAASPATSALFDMIAEDDQNYYRNPKPLPSSTTAEQRRVKLQAKAASILLAGRYRSCGDGDVALTIRSRDGFRVSMSVHSEVLASRSRFFEEKLGVRGSGGGGRGGGKVGARHVVEICECDDVEVYVEVVALMYCEDLQWRIAGEGVEKVVDLLKVSAAIVFDAGVSSCLKYLEAIPWSEDEEEKVLSALSHLQLYKPVSEVLERVSVEQPISPSHADGIISRLLNCVFHAKDDKARREIKGLMSKLLQEDVACKNTEEKNTLYSIYHECLNVLFSCLTEAAEVEERGRNHGVLMGENISRAADNLQWVIQILVSKRMGHQCVMLWADQKELARLHAKIPCMYRFEISSITAQLCIAIGQGLVLVSKDVRFSLLETWLEALYDDFAWIKRACRSVDRRMVEDGLSQTILTLPMAEQQIVLMSWFERFLNKGDDCPNIHAAFEVWWRRAFVRRYAGDQDVYQTQSAVSDHPTT